MALRAVRHIKSNTAEIIKRKFSMVRSCYPDRDIWGQLPHGNAGTRTEFKS